jgi:hypothetical protein
MVKVAQRILQKSLFVAESRRRQRAQEGSSMLEIEGKTYKTL